MKSMYGKIAIIAVLLIAIVGVVQLKQRQGATTPKPVTPPGATHTLSTSKTTAASPVKTAGNLPRLLELGSDSCRPCQMMQPVLAALRADYAGKLQVDFIDVWKDESAGEFYEVQAIPTQIFFDAKGKEIFRHVGFYPKNEILVKLSELGVK